MMTVWQYGGGTYPFSVCDEGCISRLRLALDGLRNADTGEDEGQGQAYRRMLENFFDTLFGVGTGKAVCGRGEDAPSNAYLSFTEYLSGQLDTIKEAREETEARYLSRLPEERGGVHVPAP